MVKKTDCMLESLALWVNAWKKEDKKDWISEGRRIGTTD